MDSDSEYPSLDKYCSWRFLTCQNPEFSDCDGALGSPDPYQFNLGIDKLGNGLNEEYNHKSPERFTPQASRIFQCQKREAFMEYGEDDSPIQMISRGSSDENIFSAKKDRKEETLGVHLNVEDELAKKETSPSMNLVNLPETNEMMQMENSQTQGYLSKGMEILNQFTQDKSVEVKENPQPHNPLEFHKFSVGKNFLMYQGRKLPLRPFRIIENKPNRRSKDVFLSTVNPKASDRKVYWWMRIKKIINDYAIKVLLSNELGYKFYVPEFKTFTGNYKISPNRWIFEEQVSLGYILFCFCNDKKEKQFNNRITINRLKEDIEKQIEPVDKRVELWETLEMPYEAIFFKYANDEAQKRIDLRQFKAEDKKTFKRLCKADGQNFIFEVMNSKGNKNYEIKSKKVKSMEKNEIKAEE